MSINYQVHNILHSIYSNQRNNLNIFYTYNFSLFDKIIIDIPGINFLHNGVFLNCPLSYALCVINDPIDFAQNINAYNNLYANKIIFFHEEPNASLKKEDLFLLKNSLSRFELFSFNKNYASWCNPNIRSLTYGIKPYTKQINKDKDIILLYSNSHKQTKLIYDNLKQIYPNTKLLEINATQSYDDIIEIISEYKICIDLTSYYNILCAVSVGCYGITGQRGYKDEYINQIKDYQELIDIIKKILSQFESNTDSMQKYIADNYSYEFFIENIKHIVTNYSKKAVIL